VAVADLVESYLAVLEPLCPDLLARRISLRALIARDSVSRWWEVES
jgi:hypothetical protein